MATMNAAGSLPLPAAGGVPYRVPPEPQRWPALALAAAMHAGLLLFLWAGVSWQSTPPVAVEAEVWDMQTRAAAPPALREPEPEQKQEPVQEQEQPPPPAAVALPVEQAVVPAPPDIALARAKLKAEKQKLLREQRLHEERQARELADAERKLAEKKLADKLAEKKLADKKLADKQLADKQLADKQADKKLADKRAAAEQGKLDKLRDAEMRRITGAAGATGTSGDAPKSTAPRSDSGYLASITGKIKSSTTFLGNTDVAGNPRVVFKIEELPTGEIIPGSVKMIKSSGVPAFDEAVEKGIIKSSPLPKKKDGSVERSLEIGFSMKDLN